MAVRKAALIGLGVLALSAAWISQPVAVTPRNQPGWALYDRFCVACHGSDGNGKGPAAPYTGRRPRDFTKGEFVWRTTQNGNPPTREDLKLTIRHGSPGAMPGFALTDAELDQLVDVVLAFAPPAAPADPVTIAPSGKRDPERGRQLWVEKGCITCHGPKGDGDTPVAAVMNPKPPDLTREPFRRPRSGDLRSAIVLAIATGRGAMPAFTGRMPDADLWALADHVVTLQATAKPRGPVMSALAIDLDTKARIAVGSWPGTGDDAVVFGKELAPQGTPPANLAPAEASLAAPQCARCHAKQYREWETSRHRGAMSPGIRAQMMGMKEAEALACLRCHAPLAEQKTLEATPLRQQAVSCAGCHVRGFTRHGPPNVNPSLLPIPGYPLKTLEIYERSDMCIGCHQLPPRTAVAGRPLLDTYREWLEGPYMARGVQCQHCHMPNREHEWKGVHDPHTFRQGISLAAKAHAKDGAVTVVAELANVGAGHYLPTTPTPAAWIVIELYDARGKLIEGATAEMRIGRDISYGGGKWTEHADTRIPPGEKATMSRAWKGGRTADAVSAKIFVEVHPDDYYERLYAQRLKQQLVPERRALYEQALAAGKANRYVALTRDVAIAR
jgi:mono/diheme cytochrome c family protein